MSERVTLSAEILPVEHAVERAMAPVLEVLRNGLPVAVPTETVYGLAADATRLDAVQSIYRAKGRPASNPLIIHVADQEMAKQYGVFSDIARKLVDAFWPGALTLVVPARKPTKLTEAIFAGHDTVAIRQPQGFMSELIEAFGVPLAAPSANLSGQITATEANAVYEQLSHKIPLIVDAGRTLVGVESTILRVIGDEVTLLRDGGIAKEAIEDVLQRPVERLTSDGQLLAPGMMQSHYAPKAHVVLNAQKVPADAALINFGQQQIDNMSACRNVYELSAEADLAEAAHNLFAALRAMDQKAEQICVAPIPHYGLGAAINDRLARAAAERPDNA